MSTIRFFGIICFSASLYAQLPAPSRIGPSGELQSHVQAGAKDFLGDWFGDFSEPAGARPISGVVSLRELEHPILKKALQLAHEAQQYSGAKDLPKAIAKLEKAIRIDPSYRDGHLNLGVQYARAGRIPDALTQFQTALEIGPPAVPIYIDLALTSLALREYPEAETFARKVLELEPGNSTAQRVLQLASTY